MANPTTPTGQIAKLINAGYRIHIRLNDAVLDPRVNQIKFSIEKSNITEWNYNKIIDGETFHTTSWLYSHGITWNSGAHVISSGEQKDGTGTTHFTSDDLPLDPKWLSPDPAIKATATNEPETEKLYDWVEEQLETRI